MSNINYKHKRTSTTSKRPTSSQLDIGEIAVNYDSGTPGLFLEDAAGNIIKVGPTEISGTAPNSSPSGSAGNSLGESWLDTSVTPSYLKIYDGSSWTAASGISIDSSGDGSFPNSLTLGSDFVFSPSSSAPSLTVDGDTTFEATSNTTLSAKHRGTDSTTRTGRVEMNSAGGTFGICAHAAFDGSAAALFNWSTDKISEGNISNVVRNATGEFTATFSTAFTSANYTFVASAGQGNHTSSARAVTIISRSTTTVTFLVERTDTGGNQDEDYISFIVIGTLT